MSDAWMADYLAGDLPVDSAPACPNRPAVTDLADTCAMSAARLPTSEVRRASDGLRSLQGGKSGEADPRLILGTVLDVLTSLGVPVVVDRLDRALEDVGRLLRDLGVAASDAWPVTP